MLYYVGMEMVHSKDSEDVFGIRSPTRAGNTRPLAIDAFLTVGGTANWSWYFSCCIASKRPSRDVPIYLNCWRTHMRMLDTLLVTELHILIDTEFRAK
jgi:hypothetical protein